MKRLRIIQTFLMARLRVLKWVAFIYKMYVEPLGHMLKQSDCDYQGYADDNTIWKSVDPKYPLDINTGVTALTDINYG